MLGTRGCKGFNVFLLFQAKYLPTQAGPVLKSRSIQGKEHMALHVDICMAKYEREREKDRGEGGERECVKMCMTLGMLCFRCGSNAEKVFLPGNFNPYQVWEYRFSRDYLCSLPSFHSYLAPPVPPFYLNNKKKAVVGVVGQSHTKSFLPAPNARCWHELSVFMLGVVARRRWMQVFPASTVPQSHSCAGIFLGNADRIINVSPCYFSAQPRGQLWLINLLSME